MTNGDEIDENFQVIICYRGSPLPNLHGDFTHETNANLFLVGNVTTWISSEVDKSIWVPYHEKVELLRYWPSLDVNNISALAATASSGAASADHVVEELVLELDESDLRLQRQEVCYRSQFGARSVLATSVPTQDALKRLEDEANIAAKSAVERQDILARVISDLESRNQTLLGAMEQMSTEFQVCCLRSLWILICLTSIIVIAIPFCSWSRTSNHFNIKVFALISWKFWTW